MDLKGFITQRKQSKSPLVMTHVVCGYPSFEANLKELEIMSEFGVDFVELQFPFSEPSADGPLFVKANQQSIEQGTKVADCFDFMRQVTARFDFKVLMMGYYNTVFKMGHEKFVQQLKASGGCGFGSAGTRAGARATPAEDGPWLTAAAALAAGASSRPASAEVSSITRSPA